MEMHLHPRHARMVADMASEVAHDERTKGHTVNAMEWQQIADEHDAAAVRRSW